MIAEEAQNTAPTVPYVYGLERISQRRTVVINGTSTTQIRYFDYDGHGSVRALTDPSGSVTDTYDYDAFGNLIHSTGTTQNNYLYFAILPLRHASPSSTRGGIPKSYPSVRGKWGEGQHR